ncbi:MAG: hypothetical protein IPO20_18315 [Gammaproteobacteria bacterium]|nr:hypothetical protein [Gammaproteobacteria bacterium]
MLASRLLDRREQFGKDKRPFAGWRSFAFTDQLDATNRLFYDLRDAEGRTPQGYPATQRAPNGGLAFLRRSSSDQRRYEGGQDWRMLEDNGHELTTRHRVERTTSLDTGVSYEAEIVVATAALEVGYDDPAVGVVLQHKAPRDMAQFLQRKGRAGRTRHVRPWTIMVLSDYGRDRLAYQAYEQFFDPELPPRELPLANRYIRRMQATYALIDYLGVDMQGGEPKGSVWRDLAQPQDYRFERWSEAAINAVKSLRPNFPLTSGDWSSCSKRAVQDAPGSYKWDGKNWLQSDIRRRHLVSRLAELLREPTRIAGLGRHLSQSLALPREDVDMLLWDHPRPLLLTAVPTALRRLATNWRAHGKPQADRIDRHPLPEFIPSTLFSDLALPEVQLLGGRHEDIGLPVLQAMNEMAPGKVSRRLDDALWLARPKRSSPPNSMGAQRSATSTWAPGTNSNLKFLSITSTMGKSGFATLGGRAPSISPESRNGRNCLIHRMHGCSGGRNCSAGARAMRSMRRSTGWASPAWCEQWSSTPMPASRPRPCDAMPSLRTLACASSAAVQLSTTMLSGALRRTAALVALALRSKPMRCAS